MTFVVEVPRCAAPWSALPARDVINRADWQSALAADLNFRPFLKVLAASTGGSLINVFLFALKTKMVAIGRL